MFRRSLNIRYVVQVTHLEDFIRSDLRAGFPIYEGIGTTILRCPDETD